MRTTLVTLILLLVFTTNVNAQFGMIDSSFGVDGKVTTQLYQVQAYAIAVQNSGKILVAGSRVDASQYKYDFFLGRFYTSGAIDSHFGNKGYTLTDVGGELDNAYDITIQNDGKILLAGTGSLDNQIKDFNFAIARYTSNGIPDSAFGENGKIARYTNRLGTPLGTASSIKSLDDGKILVGGISYIKVPDEYGDYDQYAGFVVPCHQSDPAGLYQPVPGLIEPGTQPAR